MILQLILTQILAEGKRTFSGQFKNFLFLVMATILNGCRTKILHLRMGIIHAYFSQVWLELVE
jgi:hypothetical protein